MDFSLSIDNVRSFAGHHDVPIRPLTVLTGENSSGKTTLLALLSAVSDPRTFPLQLAVNEPPYNLGGYETMATRRGKGAVASHFDLGFTRAVGGDQIEVRARYTDRSGEVFLAELKGNSRYGSFRLSFKTKESVVTCAIEMRGTDTKLSKTVEMPRSTIPHLSGGLAYLLEWAALRFYQTERLRAGGVIGAFGEGLLPDKALSLAPIRTQPRRTFDLGSEPYDPSGSHIPYYLERFLSGEIATDEVKRVLAALGRFGAESGLYTSVKASRVGRKVGNPFQILVNHKGMRINLIDVGYGVSQTLPIIVQSALLNENEMLLVQQPEVHLHPKAQAALGTYFAGLTKEAKYFVIETHSDYFIDRLRYEIAQKRLDPSLIGLLFLERKGKITRVHVIDLDGSGNIGQVPSGYRQFFIDEEVKILERSEKS